MTVFLTPDELQDVILRYFSGDKVWLLAKDLSVEIQAKVERQSRFTCDVDPRLSDEETDWQLALPPDGREWECATIVLREVQV